MGVFKKKPKDNDICKSCGKVRCHDNHVPEFARGDVYHEFDKPLPPDKGIFVQWVKHEGPGEVMALYCSDCGVTDFYVSPYAAKPEGDRRDGFLYWRLELACMAHAIQDPVSVPEFLTKTPLPVIYGMGGL